MERRNDALSPAEVYPLCVCRRHGVQAEGLQRLHSLPAAERRHPGPGGEGEDHARGSTRLPGSLQQLRLAVPEPGPLCGESQRLPVRLQPVGVHWSLLPHRYTHIETLIFIFKAFKAAFIYLFLPLEGRRAPLPLQIVVESLL